VQKLATSRGDALAKLQLARVFDGAHRFSTDDVTHSPAEGSESNNNPSTDNVDSVFQEFRSTYRKAVL
jgi:hypothetical protein